MRMIFLSLLCLLGGIWESEALSVTGVLGEAITIKCSHTYAFSNVKYFCKASCGNKDVLISSRKQKKDSNGRYSIRDEGNTFYVTISPLTEEDAGVYNCGIDRVGLDTYNEVILTVTKGKKKKPEKDFRDSSHSLSNEETEPEVSSSKKLVYIGVGLGVVVLALATVLLIFFRYRSRAVSTSPGKGHGAVYATPHSGKPDGHHITTSSSTACENQEAHETTSRDHADNVYSNITVSSGSQTEPDGVFYSTVSFNKHTDCSTTTPNTAAVTYSTVNYITTDESIIYSNV